MIKGVILDFDNTLYDYESANNHALNKLFNTLHQEYNHSIEHITKIYNSLNKSIKISNNSCNKFNKPIYFKKLFESLNIPLKNVTTYLQVYNNMFFEKFGLYDGVIDFCITLKKYNIKIGILSNNLFLQQLEKLMESNIMEYIDVIQTSDECGEEKPNHIMFHMIQQKMKIQYDQLAYIGDNYEHDIEPSIELGMMPFWFNKSFIWNIKNRIIHFGTYHELNNFMHRYFTTTNELIFLSKYFGQSILNVQGPGGNISVKLEDILFIKSSGFILGNMSLYEGYCLVDNKQCNKMINAHTNKITETKIFGYKTPSMETYFHSFMKKYTIHLHFTLSNIFFCSPNQTNLHNFDYNYKIIKYMTPGLELAVEIYNVYETECDIYFLKNHGLIISADTMDNIIKYYEYIFRYFNTRLDNIHNRELICNKINQIYSTRNFYKIVKCLQYSSEIFKTMIVCFPDLAVFIQKKIEIESLNELESKFDEYDIIVYENNIFVLADNITKIYALMEIVESYEMIYSKNKNNLLSIDNVFQLQNMDEEKNRRL